MMPFLRRMSFLNQSVNDPKIAGKLETAYHSVSAFGSSTGTFTGMSILTKYSNGKCLIERFHGKSYLGHLWVPRVISQPTQFDHRRHCAPTLRPQNPSHLALSFPNETSGSSNGIGAMQERPLAQRFGMP